MKKIVRTIYRKTAYSLLKKLERFFQWSLFKTSRLIFSEFNSFKVFGVPYGIAYPNTLNPIELYPPNVLSRQSPKTLEELSHPRFSELHNQSAEGKVLMINKGIATSTAANLTQHGELIFQFTEQFTALDLSKHKLFTFKLDRLPPKIEYFECTVASLSADGHNNYYHWLFDVLPRIHLISKAGLHPNKFYVESSLSFQKESLTMLGITSDQIISPSRHLFISAQSLIVPSFLCLNDLPKWICDFLKSSFVSPLNQSKIKIYITRKNAKHRRILNENEYMELLKERGFKCYELESLSFSEQVQLFSQAEAVISPHGAGLSNLAFCNSAVKVIEIFSPRFPCVCFWKLSNLLQLDYHYLNGELLPITFSPIDPGYDDIIVDIKKLKATLDLARM